ncbi:MAG TPA: GMC family oxidoreductase N-terminal domain-containing protein [Steroidobacteraceae bacterium]|jgi:choline dehydrogenase|nr:GMC family oxidoreductase N-terminal domain-containing protein [Steroidobacteraceae bacterium]
MTGYDYIIVGAGSAGCVLAARLSAGGAHRVLLLEAGGSDRSPWIEVPIGYGRTFNDPRYNWMYETEADPALDNRRAFWPRGKVLGGSGSINAMVYVRGQPQDFDDWRAAGNPGWGWQEVLPYFKKLETHPLGPSAFHGADGPILVSDVSAAVHPLCHNFLEACASQGIARTADFNGAQPEGAGVWQVSTHNGRRVSSATAYLRPARARANLTVALKAQALRIRFQEGRACAVDYLQDGQSHSAAARREVLLAAGAINSPQLLELSGVGEGRRLHSLGIPVIVDRPAVGRNLQDHVAVSYFYRSRVRTLNNQLAPWYGKLRAALTYVFTRRGPLAMSVNQAGAFVRSRPELSQPNLHIYFNPASYSTTTLGAQRRLLQPDPFAGFLMSFNTCRPTSRGSVHLRSADPLVAPMISPNSLSTEADVRDVFDGARVLRQLAGAAALAKVIKAEREPGEKVQSDHEVLADFRRRAGSVFHACGTCAMGSDVHSAVVDARLRVHGIAGLRVVDASVFPNLTSGNTNTPTVMVAEKAAELILEDSRQAQG